MPLLNPTQRKTLAALIDTIVAPVTDHSVVDSIVQSKKNQPGLAHVSDEKIRAFLAAKGTDSDHNLVQIIEDALSNNMPQDVSAELGLLLTAMSSTVGMLVSEPFLSTCLPCSILVPSLLCACGFIVGSLWVHWGFIVGLLFLHCSFIVPSLFLHCSPVPSRYQYCQA